MIINGAEFLITIESEKDMEWLKQNIDGGEVVVMIGGYRADAKVLAVHPGRNPEGQTMAKVAVVRIAKQDKIVRVDWAQRKKSQ